MTAVENMWRLFWLHLGRQTVKYNDAFNGHKTTNENTTTNKNHAASMEGGWDWTGEWWGAQGKRD